MAETQFYSTEQSGEGSDSHRNKKYVRGLTKLNFKKDWSLKAEELDLLLLCRG